MATEDFQLYIGLAKEERAAGFQPERMSPEARLLHAIFFGGRDKGTVRRARKIAAAEGKVK